MVDVSFVTYFAPILAFFVVFLVVFAVLHKSEVLGKSKWVSLFASFVIASLFISAASARRYVETLAPWFGALLVSLFFLLVIIGLFGGKIGDFKGLRIFFVIAALAIFLISGIVVFSDSLGEYLPGASYVGTPLTNWLYSPAVVGAVLLLALTAVVSWVLVKAK